MKGFSVLESMVSVAIISIMAVSMWVGYGNWRSRSILNVATQKVAADIRKVQNLAISTSQIRDPVSGNMIIPCGYGIHYFNSDWYGLFANVQDGSQSDCQNSNRVYFFSQDIDVEFVNIRQSSNAGFQGPFDDILFFPPDPLTLITLAGDTSRFISDGLLAGDTATITLCVSGGSLCRGIEVKGTGLIDID